MKKYSKVRHKEINAFLYFLNIEYIYIIDVGKFIYLIQYYVFYLGIDSPHS